MKINVSEQPKTITYSLKEAQRAGGLFTCKQNSGYIYIFKAGREDFCAIDPTMGTVEPVVEHVLSKYKFIRFEGQITLQNEEE